MKHTLCLLLIAGCMLPLFAQQTQPMATADTSSDLRQAMANLDKREAWLRVEQRKLALERKEKELAFERKTLDQQFTDRMKEMKAKGPFARSVRFLPLFVLAKLTGLLVFFGTIMRILLTVLIFNDMKYNKAMSGLWIPLVLIGGLLAALVYAMFRKSDVVKTAG